jgi:hypothetical protein
MTFIIDNSKDGQWYFVLKGRNGETVATSETYKSKQACKKAITAVKRSLFAKVIDISL